MLNRFENLAILLLVLCLHAVLVIGNVRGSTYTVSWYFQGEAVQNNTILQFNMYDTLNLVCKCVFEIFDEIPVAGFYRPAFVITKGPSPPTVVVMMPDQVSIFALKLENPGTLIYTDFDGLQPGFENFVIIWNHQAIFSTKYFRYVNIGVLRPEDSGTYHCSSNYYMDLNFSDGPGLPAAQEFFPTSGGLTIMVNTKSDQARSSRAQSANLLTYSTILIGASKLLF